MRRLALLPLLTLAIACNDGALLETEDNADLPIAAKATRNPHNPFVGVWWGIDVEDGSLHRLTVGHGNAAGEMPVHLLDNGCGICGGYPCGFKSKGRIVEPNVLKPNDITTKCKNREKDVLYYPPIVGYKYVPATDELH